MNRDLDLSLAVTHLQWHMFTRQTSDNTCFSVLTKKCVTTSVPSRKAPTLFRADVWGGCFTKHHLMNWWNLKCSGCESIMNYKSWLWAVQFVPQFFFFREVIWSCNSCSVSFFFFSPQCPSVARSVSLMLVCRGCKYNGWWVNIDMYTCGLRMIPSRQKKLHWILAESFLPDVEFSVSHPSLCGCCQWACEGVVWSMEGWAAETHSRWHFSRRLRPCLISSAYKTAKPVQH